MCCCFDFRYLGLFNLLLALVCLLTVWLLAMDFGLL